MNSTDVFIIIAIAVIIALAVFYIYRSKKSGKKCIGCPNGATCPSYKSGCINGCDGNCGNSKNYK